MVDLIPIHPISDSTSLEDCAKVAIRISDHLRALKEDEIGKNDPIVDTFFFGSADVPMKRSLVTMRKKVDWYSANDSGKLKDNADQKIDVLNVWVGIQFPNWHQ